MTDIYSENSSLNRIAENFDTDKVDGLHDYLHFYERRLEHLKNENFVLIEVGVLRGGSLHTWSNYFPNATIVGLDIRPGCQTHEHANAKVRIGDSSDPRFLFSVLKEFGEPLVFLDDGSHRWDHQISTLQIMFPLLQPGGFYIMEDIDTSFQGHLEKGPFAGLSSISAVDYLFKLARVVVGERALKDEKPFDLFIQSNAPWVGTIEFGRRTAIISKKLKPGGGPI